MDNFIMIFCTLNSKVEKINNISKVECTVTQNNRNTILDVFGASENMKSLMDMYMSDDSNIGKRLVIQGSIIFGTQKITINAISIKFIDEFDISKKENNKNDIDFSND